MNAVQRTATETAAIHQAARQLGVAVDDVDPVSQGRTGVYRVTIRAGAACEGFPSGGSVQAARVTTLTDSITSPVQTHRLVHDLHRRGAPVAGPRHRDSVATSRHRHVGRVTGGLAVDLAVLGGR